MESATTRLVMPASKFSADESATPTCCRNRRRFRKRSSAGLEQLPFEDKFSQRFSIANRHRLLGSLSASGVFDDGTLALKTLDSHRHATGLGLGYVREDNEKIPRRNYGSTQSVVYSRATGRMRWSEHLRAGRPRRIRSVHFGKSGSELPSSVNAASLTRRH